MVHGPSEGCSSLIAGRWSQDVPSAVPDDTGEPALGWQLFGTAQTGQLNIANRDKADALETIRRCEERDAAVAERIGQPWWAVLRPVRSSSRRQRAEHHVRREEILVRKGEVAASQAKAACPTKLDNLSKYSAKAAADLGVDERTVRRDRAR